MNQSFDATVQNWMLTLKLRTTLYLKFTQHHKTRHLRWEDIYGSIEFYMNKIPRKILSIVTLLGNQLS